MNPSQPIKTLQLSDLENLESDSEEDQITNSRLIPPKRRLGLEKGFSLDDEDVLNILLFYAGARAASTDQCVLVNVGDDKAPDAPPEVVAKGLKYRKIHKPLWVQGYLDRPIHQLEIQQKLGTNSLIHALGPFGADQMGLPRQNNRDLKKQDLAHHLGCAKCYGTILHACRVLNIPILSRDIQPKDFPLLEILEPNTRKPKSTACNPDLMFQLLTRELLYWEYETGRNVGIRTTLTRSSIMRKYLYFSALWDQVLAGKWRKFRVPFVVQSETKFKLYRDTAKTYARPRDIFLFTLEEFIDIKNPVATLFAPIWFDPVSDQSKSLYTVQDFPFLKDHPLVKPYINLKI